MGKWIGETVCEVGKYMELAGNRIKWRALVLAVLNLRCMLPELVIEMHIREIVF